MIHIPNETLAVDIYKVLPTEEIYADATDIWVEELGNIAAEVPVTVRVVFLAVVYVKGACDVGGRRRHADLIKLLKVLRTASEVFAKTDETFLYGRSGSVVKG